MSDALPGVEDLLDEEASGGIEPVAIGPLGHAEDVLGSLQPQLGGEQAQVRLVLANTMSQHLQRQQGLRRSCSATVAAAV